MGMHITDYRPFSPYDEEGKKMKETVFAVEADNFAKHQLWGLHAPEAARYMRHTNESVEKSYRVTSWKQDNSGWLPRIGTFGPSMGEQFSVTMSMFWNIIDGYRVLFYHLTSRYQDHDLVRPWLFMHMPHLFPNGIDNVGLLTDATNFHICLHHLQALKKAANG